MSTFRIVAENEKAYYVEFVIREGNDLDGSTEPVVVNRWVKKQHVRALNNIIRNARKGDFDEKGKLSCHYIAEKICNRFKLRHCFVNNKFNWRLFFGARDTYHNYYNLPMNILQAKGKIIYHKNGKATRL
jgi:hypothetical protein